MCDEINIRWWRVEGGGEVFADRGRLQVGEFRRLESSARQ